MVIKCLWEIRKSIAVKLKGQVGKVVRKAQMLNFPKPSVLESHLCDHAIRIRPQGWLQKKKALSLGNNQNWAGNKKTNWTYQMILSHR